MKISFGYFEIDLPYDCVEECSAIGQVDESVTFWKNELNRNEIVQINRFVLEKNPSLTIDLAIRKELVEHGAWSREELKDTEENWKRMIWIAACQANETDDANDGRE